MFKVAYVSTVDGLKEAKGLLKRIYDENRSTGPMVSPRNSTVVCI